MERTLTTRMSCVYCVLAALVAACDSSKFEDCSADENAPPGKNIDACIKSVFKPKLADVRAYEIAGVVRRGENPVPGAFVWVEPAQSANIPGTRLTSTTNAGGAYGPIPFVALRYDLSARVDRDILVTRDLTFRYFEPTLEETAPSGFARAWASRLVVSLDPPLSGTQAVAFFVTGEGALSVSGNATDGLVLLTRDFSTEYMLHAVTYDAGNDLSTAASYGKLEATSTTDQTSAVHVTLAPIPPAAYATVSVETAAPPGFTVTDFAIIAHYSRTSSARATTMVPGVAKRWPVLPGTTYTGYRIRARSADGAELATSEVPFDPFVKDQTIKLPMTVPVLGAPSEGATIGLGDRLEARGGSVFEHVLEGEGRRIAIVASEESTALPDFPALATQPPRGSYMWRVRSYPDLKGTEELSGVDTRRFRNVAISAPRTIVFP